MSAELDQLNTRLGKPATDPDRAQAALDDALVEASSLARRPEWEWSNLPDAVRVIVLHAARRTYQNPTGELTRQAGAFSTTKAPGLVPIGIFTDAEEAKLKSYRPTNGNGLWVLEVDRGDLGGDADYLDEVADIQGAKSKPFPVDESDPDWVPSLKRGIPQGDSPFRGGRGWF